MHIRVTYPVTQSQLFLRTDHDWDVNLAPVRVDGASFSSSWTSPRKRTR